MDTKIYTTTRSLADIASAKKTEEKQADKTDKTEETEDKKFNIQDFVDIRKETKEQQKQALLAGIFTDLDSTTSSSDAKQDSLSKMINSLKKQHSSIKSNLSNYGLDKQKSLRGQMSVIQNQLTTLELKQLELKRIEVGLD